MAVVDQNLGFHSINTSIIFTKYLDCYLDHRIGYEQVMRKFKMKFNKNYVNTLKPFSTE